MAKTYKTDEVLTTYGGDQKWWVVEEVKGDWVKLCRLHWSKDMVNEAGCMYRGEERLRRKVKQGYLADWKPETRYGSFEPYRHPVRILEAKPATLTPPSPPAR